MGEWRDIETAPMNEWVLAYGKSRRGNCDFVTVMRRHLIYKDQVSDHWTSGDDGYAAYLTPTHWMPLPEPPTSSV
jgi:hypothetical protein